MRKNKKKKIMRLDIFGVKYTLEDFILALIIFFVSIYLSVKMVGLK